MITALAEFLDMLYTEGVTGMPRDVCWSISLRMADPELPQAGPRVQFHAHRQDAVALLEDQHFHTIDIKFAAVEEGARVGVEELSAVANYYIRKVKEELA